MLAPGRKVSRRLICESQARPLVRGNVPLLAPISKGDGTNPDFGNSETGSLQLALNPSLLA
jgi:hypothetical protein